MQNAECRMGDRRRRTWPAEPPHSILHSPFIVLHSAFHAMPLPATLLILATLLPLASFAVLVFVGRRMGTPLAGWFATAAIGGSFLCSVLAMGYWYRGGQMITPGAAGERVTWGYNARPIDLPMKWVPIGTSSVPNSPGASGLGQSNPGWLDVGV